MQGETPSVKGEGVCPSVEQEAVRGTGGRNFGGTVVDDASYQCIRKACDVKPSVGFSRWGVGESSWSKALDERAQETV